MPYSIKKIGNATATQAGLMSAEDKQKLDAGLGFHPTRLPNAFLLFFLGAGCYQDDPHVLSADELQYLDGLTPAMLSECRATGLRLRAGADLLLEENGTPTEEEKRKASFPVKVDFYSEGENVDGTEAFRYFLTLDSLAIDGILCGNVYFSKAGGQLLKAEGYQLLRTFDADQYARATSLFSAWQMGLCPQAPSADAAKKFLRGDGTWAAAGGGEEGDALPAQVRTFTNAEPFPFIGNGYASDTAEQLNSDFDPAALFPFEGRNARMHLRGYGQGKSSTGPICGTLDYGICGNELTAFLDVSGTGSMPWHYRRTRVGSFTQAADGTFTVQWIFPWITPEEQ